MSLGMTDSCHTGGRAASQSAPRARDDPLCAARRACEVGRPMMRRSTRSPARQASASGDSLEHPLARRQLRRRTTARQLARVARIDGCRDVRAPLPIRSSATSSARDRALAAGVTPRRLRATGPRTRRSAVCALRPTSRRRAFECSATCTLQPLERVRRVRRDVIREARAHTICADARRTRSSPVRDVAAVIFGGPDRSCATSVAMARARTPRARAPRRAPASAASRLGDPARSRFASHDGLRVASPASTWAHAGCRVEHRGELVTVGDAFVRVPRDDSGRLRAGAGLATIEELKRAAAAGPRSGAARLRDARRADPRRKRIAARDRVPARRRGRADCPMRNSTSRSSMRAGSASVSPRSSTARIGSWWSSKAITTARAARNGTATSRSTRPTSRKAGKSCA